MRMMVYVTPMMLARYQCLVPDFMMLSNVTLRGRTVLPLTAHYIAPCHRAIEYLVPDEGQREGATPPP